MADGWRCPECHLILAPDVREHRCAPPEGGVSVRPVVAPYSPSSGETRTWTSGGGISVTPGITYTWPGAVGTGGGGGGGGGWTSPPGVQSVRVGDAA